MLEMDWSWFHNVYKRAFEWHIYLFNAQAIFHACFNNYTIALDQAIVIIDLRRIHKSIPFCSGWSSIVPLVNFRIFSSSIPLMIIEKQSVVWLSFWKPAKFILETSCIYNEDNDLSALITVWLFWKILGTLEYIVQQSELIIKNRINKYY